MKAFSSTELVHAACIEFPGLPSRTLARKLFNENKGVWDNLDAARIAIGRRRGRVKDKRHRPCVEVVPSTAPRFHWNPEAYLPKSEEKPFLPHIVSVDRTTRAGVLGDIHLPYHNLPALAASLQQGQKRDWRILILHGDTVDFHRLSRFQKDPRSRKAVEEIAAANQLLDAIDELFPKARKIFKFGNHEERYDNYLAAHAEELFDVVKNAASLEKLLALDSRGWEVVSEKRPIYLGGLTLLHGHEYATPVLGPVNAARGLFLRTKANAMVHHHHQTSEHTEPTVRGKLITTWSVGCLCELNPMYMRFNKWNHGCAEVELAPDGEFMVHNFRIRHGKIV